jgi:hypothetical protein
MPSLSIKRRDQPGRLTSRDRRQAELFRWAPWLTFLIIAFGPSGVFLLLSLLTSGGAAAYLLLALVSFPFALVAGLISILVFLLFRRSWTRRVRQRLAMDGVTADEIDWFRSELTSNERRSLKEMDERQPLLADAYRETLALRLNASRVIANARRDLLQAERRISRAGYLRGTDTSVLLEDLRRDRARLESVKREGTTRLDQAQARLQMIEAAASRGASWAETNYMLQRLDEGQRHAPLAIESAREQQQLLEDAEREIRKEGTTRP